jgi:hypothetical protein
MARRPDKFAGVGQDLPLFFPQHGRVTAYVDFGRKSIGALLQMHHAMRRVPFITPIVSLVNEEIGRLHIGADKLAIELQPFRHP